MIINIKLKKKKKIIRQSARAFILTKRVLQQVWLSFNTNHQYGGWCFYAQNRGDHMEIRARPRGLIFM